jgi:uncharacterized membrane protein YbhN (UPF0104 family)
MNSRRAFYIKIVFAIISLAVLFQFVPLSDIADVISNANVLWFAVGLLLQFLTRVAATFQMRVVTANQGVSLGLWQLYRLLLATQFYSLMLPGPLAGGGVAWAKYLQHGADKETAAAVVVLNRAIGLGLLTVVGACAWVIDRHSDRPMLVASTIFLAILGVAIVLLLPPQKTGAAPSPLDEPHTTSGLSQFWHRLFLFRRISRSSKLIILASALTDAMLTAAVILSFALAVNIELTMVSALWIRAALQVTLFLPITLAGMGVREVSLVGLGTLVGIPSAAAIAWSFTILAGTIVVAAVGGLVEANAATHKVEGYMQRKQSGEPEKRERR